MATTVDAREAQRDAAARRIADSTETRRRNADLVRRGTFAAANPPELLVRRLDRLSRYYAGDRLPGMPAETPAAADEATAADAMRRAALARLPLAVEAAAAPALEQVGLVLEAVVGRADFLDVRYLEAGVAAARAVARVHIGRGGEGGFGSGSLVTPHLLLTNHHVLSDAGTAAASKIEFDFQLGLDGQPLPSRIFGLDPDAFFVADPALDFALVAVAADAGELAQFGVNRIVEAQGKAAIGDFATVIQHPAARRKEISLRENRTVAELEQVLHYAADTEPGSSGSPVFNDQWEIVALHHASVRVADQAELGGVVNEGIRISRIARFVRDQPFAPAQQALVDQLGTFERIVVTTRTASASAAPAAAEKIEIDPDYAARRGYDPAFLGAGTPVPLPQLPEALRSRTAVNPHARAGEDQHVLPYHHFSVVLDTERRLARCVAVNVDGAKAVRLKRERDRWTLDPRVPAEQQAGEAVYADNPLDRGHLVRRLDPAWGTAAEAKLANDDTFHFTNCTPQHEDFNQRKTTWAGLEDYILENADNRDLRVSVLTGPVLAEDDDEYRGVKLPRQFWKVVAMVKGSGSLSATAYLLSQEQLLREDGFEALAAPPAEEFSYGAYRTFQVPIAQVEALTGLSFGALGDADPLARLETTAATAARPVERLEDLVL